MAVLLVSDNSGIGCAGWVLRSIIFDISEVLRENHNDKLADWLTSDLSPVQLYKVLDVRDLTQKNQNAFKTAIMPAYIKAKNRGPQNWNDTSAWEGYINLFSNLAQQIEDLAQGKIPEDLPNLRGISKHDGSKSGPGWGNEI